MAPAETSGPDNVVVIKVIGAGGAGNNAINRMIESGVENIEFIAVNTDKPALSQSRADKMLQIGAKITKGQGAGADPETGKRAAEENRNDIAKELENTHMVFITCGMGGGTGTGAAPIIAEIAREMNILTVGVVTKPFKFEGARRMRQAEAGISNLIGKVDALFVIPNERLKDIATEKITLVNSFVIADSVLRDSVLAISELVTRTDMINLDFADITTNMKESGYAHMGVGKAAGKNKAEVAARMAITSDLMETSIQGARGIIVHVMGSSDLALEEAYAAAELVEESAHPDANIIFGAGIDDDMGDEMRVTVIATRFEDSPQVSKQTSEVVKLPSLRPEQQTQQQEAETVEQQQPVVEEAKPQPVAKPVSPPPSRTPSQQAYKPETQDDDPFDEIYRIFNQK